MMEATPMKDLISKVFDIFQGFFTGVLERQVQPAAKLAMRAVGDRDAVRVGDFLQTRGDVYAITEYIAVLDNDVTCVDANA